MPRGQIPNAALRRYDDVSCIPAVYLMEIGPDAVKVGVAARSVHSRLRELHTTLVRLGYEPGRFATFASDEPRRRETACIHELQRVAQPMPGRREYFTGISFDAAVAVVEKARA